MEIADIKNEVVTEIHNRLTELGNTKFGTIEYQTQVRDLKELYDLMLEHEKMDNDYSIDQSKAVLETEIANNDYIIKDAQLEANKEQNNKNHIIQKDQVKYGIIGTAIGVALTAGQMILSYGFQNKWFHEGLRFEQDGIWTSTMNKMNLRNLIKK